MRLKLFPWWLWSLIIACVACQPDYLDREALNAYLADESNGLSNEMKAGGLHLKVTYRPTDLLVDQDLGHQVTDMQKVHEYRHRYEDYIYFVLNLEANGRDVLYGTSINQQDFGEKLQTLSFRMGEYVELTTALGDTIPVADYIYHRNFGIEGSSALLFVFHKEKIAGQPWVSFDLKEFGLGIGTRRFRFQTDDLERAPKLKFDTEQNT